MRNRHDPKYDPKDIESVRELHDFLTGTSVPEGIEIGHGHQPRLTRKQAFTAIWFMQEHMGIIPDHYEQCDRCGHLFDDDCEGRYDDKKEKHFCDNCC
jgi:hypothetical protein